MESTLQALGGILLKAIPTFLLLIVVHLYLKYMFFKPLAVVLEKRRQETEGARQAAEQAVAKSGDRAGEIEAALRKAREEIYQEQEAAHKRMVEEQTQAIDQAREQAHATVHQAREQLTAEAEAAKKELSGLAQQLGEQIAQKLLRRRAA